MVNWNPQVFFTWVVDKSHLSGGSITNFWKKEFIFITVKFNLISFVQESFTLLQDVFLKQFWLCYHFIELSIDLHYAQDQV